ncbi:MAG TPA: response regulator [Thermoflexus sp.]|nr:response regulator [Thermoflexus sp.]
MSALILYIEDNFENRLLVRRILEAEGYRVVEAEDGPRGLEIARSLRPDLILVDLHLPDIDGYELVRRFKQMPHLKGVPIVALTADVIRGTRERALATGCDGYIPKPIDVDALPGQIATFLRNEEGHDGR